jgi:hypothetical protein
VSEDDRIVKAEEVDPRDLLGAGQKLTAVREAVDVAAANPTRKCPYEHFARAGLWNRKFFY